MPRDQSIRRQTRLAHFDTAGQARMVDVSAKPATVRTAVASGIVRMETATADAIRSGTAAKGDVLQVARIAGIQAAKQTANLIPLCHSIPLASVTIDFSFRDSERLAIRATVKAEQKTGVEMEALTAVAISALTIYDMCKSLERGMSIESIQLEEKAGGKSGIYRRSTKLK